MAQRSHLHSDDEGGAGGSSQITRNFGIFVNYRRKVGRLHLLRFLDGKVALQFPQRIRGRADIAHDDAALNDGNPAADLGDVG